MEVGVFTGRAEELRPIAEAWRNEHKASDWDIEADIEEHLNDLQSLISSYKSDLLVLMDKVPVGYMGLTVFKNPMGTELFTNEHYFYIIPEKRGGMGAVRLIRAAQNWAKTKGCKFLLLNASNIASNLHDNTCRLYEKLGFRHFETTYIQRV